jgi:putative transposase
MQTAQQLAEKVGLVAACKAMRVSRASVYRDRQPAVDRAGVPSVRHPRALSEAERADVITTLNSDRFVDCAPAAVHAMLLEENRYLCSVSTMYRVLTSVKAVRERRAQRRHPHYTAPQLLATCPNTVWSWDITKLLGARKWEYFHLYVMLDIYSRYVVGWLVAERESGALAKQLIATCYQRQGILPGQLTIHSDRGTAMTAKPVIGLLTTLDVHKTVSRPHVSNDNPFSESQFKTMKYRPAFPRRFGCIQDARATLEPFFAWYN